MKGDKVKEKKVFIELHLNAKGARRAEGKKREEEKCF